MVRNVLVLVVPALLFPATAAAQWNSAPFLCEHSAELLGVDDFEYDTGWIPSGSPIQVRFYAHAGNTVFVSMDGEGIYDWQTGEISFEGLPDGGWFDVDVGVDVSAQVQFDILGIQWTGDLIDPFLYGIFETVTFDPYLLVGNLDRPAIIDAVLPRETLADVPLGIDLLIASGNLHVEVGGHIHAELVGTSITAWAASDDERITVITEEGASGALPPDAPWTDFDTFGQLRTHISAEFTLLLYPSVVLEVLGQEFTLAEFEVPIDTPPQDVDWAFDPVPIHFEAPPEPTPEPTPEPGDDDDSAVVQGDGGDDDPARVESFGGCGCEGAPVGAASPALSIFGAWLLVRRGRGRTKPPMVSVARSGTR